MVFKKKEFILVKQFFYLLVLNMVWLFGCSKQSPLQPIDAVNPFIGTDAHGHTFPGATLPFGMIQLSPSNDFKGWDWCSGYHYSDSILKGFAHTHVSGAGLAGLGDILLMPTSGMVKLNPGTEESPESGYRSRFVHNNESASPGYYSVILEDYDIQVELTATTRVGFHRYTFNKGGNVNVVVDPTHNIMEKIHETEVELVSKNTIRGYKKCSGEAGNRTVFFYAEFSKPFEFFGISNNDSFIKDAKKYKGSSVKSYVTFNTKKSEEIEVKVALSFVSYDGAKANMEAEGKGKSFDQVHQEAIQIWKRKLDKIEVEGKSIKDKRIFYTAMYRSFISPNVISDVDGNYVVEGEMYYSDIPQYSNFSTWDTFRALHPLFTIIEQKGTADFINSLISRYSDSKVGLPVWELLGHDNVCMIGYNTASPIADAVLKDIKGIEPEKAYQAIKAAAISTDKHSPNYDKNGMEEYLQLGFVPAELNCAVSKTTEQNYYDWGIAQVANKLGYQEDAETFLNRSIGYRNLFNNETNFLNAKYSTGEWREMDISIWDDLIGNYGSGNMWGYSSYVPHDIEGLIKLIGGREAFSKWLDKIFSDTTTVTGHTHVDISGFIGKYGHGDEPSHHMPYLYNYAGKPWKTQKLVRKVIEDFYGDGPDGMINNEDLGQMSAWYIFSTLGFYPVCPGDLKYIVGTPLFDKASIKLESGKHFRVIAESNSKKNKYIQSVTLNGKPLKKTYITHDQIMRGGELVFEMGSKPNKEYGTKEDNMPVSAVGIDKEIGAQVVTYKPFDKDESEVFESSRNIELICNTPGAKIYYTLDGKKPDKKSKKYNGEFEITESTKLRAIAFKEDLKPSFIYNRDYYQGKSFKDLGDYPKITLKYEPERYGSSGWKYVIR